MINLDKYTSHFIGEQKEINEQIKIRLGNIERVQRCIALQLYSMDGESAKIFQLTSTIGESSKSPMENHDNFIFEPP